MTTSAAPRSTRRPASPHNGAALPDRTGKKGGGKKGRSGRPTLAFAAFVARLRDSEKFQQAVERIAHDEEARNWGHVARLVAQYDPDLPERKLRLEGQVTVTGVIALPVVQMLRPPDGEVGGVVQGERKLASSPSVEALRALAPLAPFERAMFGKGS